MAKTAKAAKPVKKTAKKTVKKVSAKKIKHEDMKSFKLYKEPGNFVSYKFTKQTVYWIILLIAVAVLTLWVLKLQVDLYMILDSIQTS